MKNDGFRKKHRGKKIVAIWLSLIMIFTGVSFAWGADAANSAEADIISVSELDILPLGSQVDPLQQEPQIELSLEEARIEALTIEPDPESDIAGYIVSIKDGAMDGKMKAKAGSAPAGGKFFVVNKPEDALDFANTGQIEYIEPNYLIQADAWPTDPPNDPGYSSQWDLTTAQGINAPATWKAGYFGAGVVVAVCDSGINRSHEDFVGANIAKGWTFLTNSSGKTSSFAGAEDDNKHGSHVSSTIMASVNNGKGIAGIASKVTLLPIKILDSKGSGTTYDLIQAFDYAMKQGADVVNCSIGSPPSSDRYGGFFSLQDMIDQLNAKNIIVVSAVGNEALDGNPYEFPASCKNVIGVGSVGTGKNVSSFSNYNESVDVTAPGEGIWGCSTSATSYSSMSGTSMATPHVTALAAIGKEYAKKNGKTLSEGIFLNLLKASSIDRGTAGLDKYYGWGVINIANFLNAANSSSLWVVAADAPGLPNTDPAYYLSYNPRGGTLSASAPKAYYPSKGLKLPVPKLKGYDFAGWCYWSNSLRGYVGPFYELKKGAYGDFDFVANWKVAVIKYTLNANGGKKPSKTKFSFTYGKTVKGLPTKMTRAGYTFKGWYTAKSGGKLVKNGIKATVSRTLYARWSGKTYKVTLNVNKGKTLKKKTYSFKCGSKYKKLPTPTRAGYKFAGWYTKKFGGTKIVNGGTVKITKNTTFYARWKKK